MCDVTLSLYFAQIIGKLGEKKLELSGSQITLPENVFVKHYAPNHMPGPKGEWLLHCCFTSTLRSCRDGQLT